MNTYTFNPNIQHAHLADNTHPLLAYAGQNVRDWQMHAREKLTALLGIPEADKTPLAPRTCWTREYDEGVIEHVVYTSEAHADVPAYVCLPRNAKPPYRWMICLQGHSTGMHQSVALDFDDETKRINVPNDKAFALGAMKRGVAALCIEQRGFGLRRDPRIDFRGKDMCRNVALDAFMLGRTLLGERVFDVRRGIDYLLTRNDLNENYIGVMGNSAGGTVSLFTGAIDNRVTHVMPSSSFYSFRKTLIGGNRCICGYVPSLSCTFEVEDVAGLIAPRPLVIVAGKDDLALDVVHASYENLLRIYHAYNAEENCVLVEGNGGHRFFENDAWRAMLPYYS